MADVSPDQIVEAAESLDQAEFSRGDLADKLGVEKADLRKSFRIARKSGRLEKVRDDEENTGFFRLTGK
jgi:hypothetical protein